MTTYAKRFSSACGQEREIHHNFFEKKSLTILPKIVIPKIMPMIIPRGMAIKSVSLKTMYISGMRTAHTIMVRHPVAKSLASNIAYPFLFPFPFTRTVVIILCPGVHYIRYDRMREELTHFSDGISPFSHQVLNMNVTIYLDWPGQQVSEMMTLNSSIFEKPAKLLCA
jgi:hypothetical protein